MTFQEGGNCMNEGKPLQAFECTRCSGKGEVIVDWDAYNQLSRPIGFSSSRMREYLADSQRAFGKCPNCNGRGFILRQAQ